MIWAVLADRSVSACARRQASGGCRAGAGCAIFTRYDGWVYAAVAWFFATGPMLRTPPSLARARGGRVGVVYRPADCRSFVVAGLQRKAIWGSTGLYPWSLLRPRHRSQDHAARFVASSGHSQHARLGALFSQGCGAGRGSPSAGKAAVLAQRRAARWPPCGPSAAGRSGRCCCCGCRCPSTLTPWLMDPCPSSFPSGGLSPGTTRAMAWSCCPPSRCSLGCLLPVLTSRSPKVRRYAVPASLLLVVANSVVLLRARPLVFQEAVVNARTRVAFETALAKALSGLPAQGLDSDARLQRCRRVAASGHPAAPHGERRRLPDLAACSGRSGAKRVPGGRARWRCRFPSRSASSSRLAAGQRSLLHRPALRPHLPSQLAIAVSDGHLQLTTKPSSLRSALTDSCA